MPYAVGTLCNTSTVSCLWSAVCLSIQLTVDAALFLAPSGLRCDGGTVLLIYCYSSIHSVLCNINTGMQRTIMSMVVYMVLLSFRYAYPAYSIVSKLVYSDLSYRGGIMAWYILSILVFSILPIRAWIVLLSHRGGASYHVFFIISMVVACSCRMHTLYSALSVILRSIDITACSSVIYRIDS